MSASAGTIATPGGLFACVVCGAGYVVRTALRYLHAIDFAPCLGGTARVLTLVCIARWLCTPRFKSPTSLGGHRRHGCASTGGPQGTRACLATNAQKRAAAKLSPATIAAASGSMLSDFKVPPKQVSPKAAPQRSHSREKPPQSSSRGVPVDAYGIPCSACQGRHRAHTCGMQKNPSAQQKNAMTVPPKAPPGAIPKAVSKAVATAVLQPAAASALIKAPTRTTATAAAAAEAAAARKPPRDRSNLSLSTSGKKPIGKRQGGATKSRKRAPTESQEGAQRGSTNPHNARARGSNGEVAGDSRFTPPRDAGAAATTTTVTTAVTAAAPRSVAATPGAAPAVLVVPAKRQRVPMKAPPSFAFTGFGIGTPKVLLNKLDTRVRSLGESAAVGRVLRSVSI